jgi:hypothetical protein
MLRISFVLLYFYIFWWWINTFDYVNRPKNHVVCNSGFLLLFWMKKSEILFRTYASVSCTFWSLSTHFTIE